MRDKIIFFLKKHPKILNTFWECMSYLLKVISVFLPINEKRIIFSSFGGRSFNDSPKALYDKICECNYFDDWDLIWAFIAPDNFELQRGKKVKIDTISFFKMLLSSKVWISNSGMARGINIHRKGIIEVETWHGTPLKKIGGEENQNSIAPNRMKKNKNKLDSSTIRCAQSKFDQKIFSRIFNANKNSILLCDLPRNDKLLDYSNDEIMLIKKKLSIPSNKKVILYAPTYREYLVDNKKKNYIAPPLNLNKWKKEIGNEYVMIIRAHYVVTKSLNIMSDDFIYDVTNYPNINDLYLISDILISDYSSVFFDYSILCKPMLCFAYDLEEYNEKRGLYLDLKTTLPCSIDKNEDDLIFKIKNMNYDEYANRTMKFHQRFTPFAGNACETIINTIIKNIERKN